MLDLGTQFSKAGYAGEDTPKAVFHTSVGSIYSDDMSMDVDVTQHSEGAASTTLNASAAAAASSSSGSLAASTTRGGNNKQYFVGRSQLYRRDHMQISQPLQHGLVRDWDAVEAVWSYALWQHLKVDAREHPIMLSEPTFQPAADREKMLQLMFEQFETPAAFLCKSSVLTAFSAGRSTACVVESGAGHSTVAPIHDGYVVTKGVRRTHMAGAALDDVLEKVLTQEGDKRINITPAVRQQQQQQTARQSVNAEI